MRVFFVPLPGFSGGQPDFLSLWHTQQSFLLDATGEWTRQHNGYHLGIMSSGSMKWSCRAWQVGTMGDIWAPERALGLCRSHEGTEGTDLYKKKGGGGGTITSFLNFACSQIVLGADWLPNVVCPQRDLQLPQDFGRFLHPPAKLLQQRNARN